MEATQTASALLNALAVVGPNSYLPGAPSVGPRLSIAADRPLPDLEELAASGPWGARIFERAREGWRSPMRWFQDRLFDEMMRDPALKKRMIAFLDVSTGVPAQGLSDYLRQYFPDGTLPSSGFLRPLLAAGSSAWLPGAAITLGIQGGLSSMARRFLAGETVPEAVVTAARLQRQGAFTTLDVVWEHVVSEREADQYLATVVELMEEWGRSDVGAERTSGGVPIRHISVKLSALTGRFEPLATRSVMERAGGRLLTIFQKAKALQEAGRPVLINVDLEERQVRDLTYRVVWQTLMHPSLAGWDEVGLVCQAYLRDSEAVLMQLIDLAARTGKKIQIRIVKGAYHQYEQIVAARKGWEVPVYLSPADTDHNFRRLVRLALLNHPQIRLAIGSHNLLDVALVQNLRETLSIPIDAVEQQFLLGVGDHLGRATADLGIPTRFYGPFGDRRKAIGYQVRRLDEVTPDSAIGQTRVTGDWEGYVRARRERWNPPEANGERHRDGEGGDVFRNEPEADFSDGEVRSAMHRALLDRLATPPPDVSPWIGGREVTFEAEGAFASVEPAAHDQSVASVMPATPSQVEEALRVARDGHRHWSGMSQRDRSSILRMAAQAARKSRYEIAADIILEAGKPWGAALADVEEGIDFLEAYARDGLRESPRRGPLGVGVAISPFNYPFAIAMGEMAGGLALGNAMILKPAAQTSLIGRHVVRVLREGGVPPEAVQFLPGSGSKVGQALVESPDVDFIVFTGSKETADRIIRTASATAPRGGGIKIVVAETGGKNPILVDESADLDVAVDAVLAGAFGMTGQRCSATSRAIVVASKAEEFVERLVEGAKSLIVGDPRNPDTQVGPLIDGGAMGKVLEYVEIGRREATLRYAAETRLARTGFFVGPHIFTDVDPKSRLAQEEIFGPILSVITAQDFAHALQIANDVPYALTAALISRTPEHIREFFDRIDAGVAYVNRPQIGARVVEQPFGGFKDSGTGPKAGGPHYVARFGRPRVRTVRGHSVQDWLSRYEPQAREFLSPRTTLELPGEINEEAHDRPLGTGLIRMDHESSSDVIAGMAAAVLMGNRVVLPETEETRQLKSAFEEAGIPSERIALRGEDFEGLLADPSFDFLVVNGDGASQAAACFLQASSDRPSAGGGFRRIIGITDDPSDSAYLTRFAHSRTRSERTLRHGADLDLRRPMVRK